MSKCDRSKFGGEDHNGAVDLYTYRYLRLAYDDGLLRSSLRGGEIEIAWKLDREDLANGSTFVNVQEKIFPAGRKRKKCEGCSEKRE